MQFVTNARITTRETFVFGVVGTIAVAFTALVIAFGLGMFGVHPGSSLGGSNTTVINNGGGVSTGGNGLATVAFGGAVVQTVDKSTTPSLTNPVMQVCNSFGQSIFSVSSLSSCHTLTYASSAFTAQTLQFQAADNQRLFLYLNPGTAHFLDINNLKALNTGLTPSATNPTGSRIVEVRWTQIQGGTSPYNPISITGGTAWTIVVTLDLSNLPVQNGVQPAYTLTMPVAADISGSTAISAPSALTSQGTASKTVTSTWSVTGAVDQDAIDIVRVYTTVNQTTTQYITPNSLTVSGWASYGSGQFTTNTCGTSSSGIADCWDLFNPGNTNQIGSGLLAIKPIGTTNTLYFALSFTETLPGSGHVGIVLDVQQINAASAGALLSATLVAGH